MKIEVFDSGCCNKSNIYELVVKAANESAGPYEVSRITDSMEAVKRGIIRNPALVVDGKVVCAGRVPKYDEIVNWLASKP